MPVVSLNSLQLIPAYGRWMVQFPLVSGVDRVEFTTPDGHLETRPAFLYQPTSFSYDCHGYETVTPAGEVLLQARFTPERPGVYLYRALRGETTVAEGRFECIPSSHPGYIRVSQRDPRYFVHSDGSSYCPIGLNMVEVPMYPRPQWSRHFLTSDELDTLGVREYQRWFRLLAQNGGNYIRLFLGNLYLQMETEVAGEMNLLGFARLDAILDLARQCNIRIKMCFDHFRTFDPNNPHWMVKVLRHPETGQSPKNMDEFFSSPEWRALWLKKVHAYLARYGDDPVVFAWELWNEVNCNHVSNWDVARDWSVYMMRQIQPLARQMVVNSLGSFDADSTLQPYRDFQMMPEMPFQQVHRYLDQGAPWDICTTDPVVFSLDAIRRTRRPDKPILLAETGAVNDCHVGPFRYYRHDNRGVIFHDCVYPAFFAGAAGPGHIWHWHEYVDAKNLWHAFKPLADLVAGIQLDAEDFQPIDLSTEAVWILGLKGRRYVLLWLRNKADRWDYVLRDELSPPWISPMTIDLKALDIQAEQVQVYSPFQGDFGAPTLEGERLTLPAFRYGMLVRIEQSPSTP